MKWVGEGCVIGEVRERLAEKLKPGYMTLLHDATCIDLQGNAMQGYSANMATVKLVR